MLTFKFHLPKGLEMKNLLDLETNMNEKPKEQESRLNYFVRTEVIYIKNH